MQYTLEHIKLLKARDGFYQGKTIKGGYYIQATLIDDEDEEDGMYTSNDDAEVARYQEYLTPAVPNGQDQFGRTTYADSLLKDASKPLPDKLLHKTGDWETVKLPGNEPYVPVRGNDQTGKLEVIVNKYGAYKTMASVEVFCRKRSDGTYRHGWTPEARVSTMIGRTIAPLSQVVLPNGQGGVINQAGVVLPGMGASAGEQGQGGGTVSPNPQSPNPAIPPQQ